jgi:hypothetical protein
MKTRNDILKDAKLIKVKHYWICDGYPREIKKGETNCKTIFFNGDDNVCLNCGSKNTRKIFYVLAETY